MMGINIGNFLSAAEMRNHTNEFFNAATIKELKELYEMMYKSEQYSIKVSDLSWSARVFLEEKGYKVRYLCDQREGESYYIISWR